MRLGVVHFGDFGRCKMLGTHVRLRRFPNGYGHGFVPEPTFQVGDNFSGELFGDVVPGQLHVLPPHLPKLTKTLQFIPNTPVDSLTLLAT